MLRQVQHGVFILFICISACSCSSKPAQNGLIHLTLSPNKQSIKITGLEYAVIQDIGRDSSGAAWQSLMPVYKMPADTDLKNYQPAQPGNYAVKDSAVVFTPDTPFAAKQIYFVRYYKFNQTTKASDFITGHNKLGSLHYTDLIFKP